jgi:hypothetical protein
VLAVNWQLRVVELGALGWTRTPNLLIRRSGFIVCPVRAYLSLAVRSVCERCMCETPDLSRSSAPYQGVDGGPQVAI